VAGFNAAFFLGLEFTSAINGALIMALNPLITVLMETILDGSRVTARHCLGMTLSFGSVLFVISGGTLEAFKTFHVGNGDILLVIGSLCFSYYGIGCRKYTRDASPLLVTGYTMVFGALPLLAAAFLFSPNGFPALNVRWSVHAAEFFIGFFGTMLAYLFWNLGVKRVGTANTFIFFNLVPVVTMLFSAILGNPLRLGEILGGVGVVMGVSTATGALDSIWSNLPAFRITK
jgi:drug/metabolite transporter (DMT)-like permease